MNHDENYPSAKFALKTLASAYVDDNFSRSETIKAKKNDLKKFLAFLEENEIELLEDLGRMPPVELYYLCRQFLNVQGEYGDGARTLRRRLSTIKNFLNHLTETHTWILPIIPNLNCKELNQCESRSSSMTITMEEWRKLKEQLKRARNPQVLPLACLAVMGGGRTFSECRKMTWRDVKFNSDVIVIRKAQWENYLALVPELKKILKNFNGTKDQDEPLFTIHPQVMNKTLKAHARRVGIDDSISFMTFRASFIQWAAERGDSLNEVINATLHKSPQTMQNYYYWAAAYQQRPQPKVATSQSHYSKQVIPASSILNTQA